MRTEILLLALIVGGFTWAFRALPLLLNPERLTSRASVAKLLAATGPAAIATLFVAGILPLLQPGSAQPLPLAGGTAAVLAVWFWRHSVVAATLAGSIAYGLVFAMTS